MTSQDLKVGWIGTGRMGYAMAARLLKAGCQVAVFNRTRRKAEPLQSLGARLVDRPADLAECDIVFTMVSGPDDLTEVVCGPQGLLSGPRQPRLLVDCSSVSEAASLQVRNAAAVRGTAMIAAPVSGNAKVVKAGRLTVVASGPAQEFEIARPLLQLLGNGVTYVGEGERSRIVKICHNLLLGVVAESLAEITVLAERAGVPRHAFLEFINLSVMGSTFSRYKTPAFVKLDFTPTFTPVLLCKDLDLGLESGRRLGVPLPLIELTRNIVQEVIDQGETERDFAVLLLNAAKRAGIELQPESVEVDDGLH